MSITKATIIQTDISNAGSHNAVNQVTFTGGQRMMYDPCFTGYTEMDPKTGAVSIIPSGPAPAGMPKPGAGAGSTY